MAIRSFSSQFEDTTAKRDVDNDAPAGLRQEWVDTVYLVLERQPPGFSEDDERKLYNIISQSLGIQPSGRPYRAFAMLSVATWSGLTGNGFMTSLFALLQKSRRVSKRSIAR